MKLQTKEKLFCAIVSDRPQLLPSLLFYWVQPLKHAIHMDVNMHVLHTVKPPKLPDRNKGSPTGGADGEATARKPSRNFLLAALAA